MLSLLAAHGGEPGDDAPLVAALAAHDAEVLRSANAGRRAAGTRPSPSPSPQDLVTTAEDAVRAAPAAAFRFAPDGHATLQVGSRSWAAGRFQPTPLGRLRAGTGRGGARCRLWVVDGAAAPTDIGALQAHAPARTLFQVASQFNCLEAPGPWITPVARYLSDPTQGPRASVSAFPGTLLRHYAAPGPGGERFVQTDGGRQVELLGAACDPDVARVQNGYLTAEVVRDPGALVAALADRFDEIAVGLHEDVEVVLGYDWDGAVPGPPGPRIAQVFTSTLAAGGYAGAAGPLRDVCRLLLRAAYLGTLLAAMRAHARCAALTLIGGGVFGNPIDLIWQSILWAFDEAAPLAPVALDVVVNGRDIGRRIDGRQLASAAVARGGALVTWPRSGPPAVAR